MDLRRLAFLVRIIDLGSITRAADALGIAQPALSQHVQALERSFGAKLLQRSARGVKPTPAGDLVYRNAKAMERQLQRIQAEVRVLAEAPAGRVTLGVAPHSRARRLIQPLLRAAAARYPDVVLHISENFEAVLTSDLLLKRVDMAFLYELVPRDGLRYLPIREERLLLVGNAAIMGRQAVAAAIPLLLPQPTHALRQLVDATFGSRGEQAHVIAEIESFETLAAAVRAGLGATILPESVARDLAAEAGLRLRAFGGPRTQLPLSLCITEEESHSAAVLAVYGLVTEMARGIASTALPA
jgi:LysR family nitrogen assimilation transcriptional regulator